MDLWQDKNLFAGHRVIEASAGTGKTYTLIKLAVTLIEENKAAIEQILIVTYTEKAVGEIKDRFLTALKDSYKKATEDSKRTALEVAIENYELASVSTIHGFCQRTLSQFSFENRLLSGNELVDDNDVHERILRKVQRKLWPEWLGHNFRVCLSLFGYPNISKRESLWEGKILELSNQFNPIGGDKLLPEVRFDIQEAKTVIDVVAGELAAAKSELKEWLKQYKHINSFFEELNQLNTKGNMYRTQVIYDELIVPFLEWGKSADVEGADVLIDYHNNFYEMVKKITRFTRTDKPDIIPLDIEFKKSGNNLDDVCPNLTSLSAIWDTCRRAIEEITHGLKTAFEVETILKVQELSDESKIENGQQSYQDMLNRVWQALSAGEGDSPLVKALRSTYKFALVDEFQDTDSLQWGIFHKIFMADPASGHKMIVIGDPKQSIYRFRGADVFAYQNAREAIRAGENTNVRTLSQNFRTVPGMLTGLNHLFDASQWFLNGDTVEDFKVTPPESNDRIGLSKDESGRAPITIMSPVKKDANTSTARIQLATFTANEINRLLGRGMKKGAQLRIKDDGLYRDLNEDDICILLMRRGEFPVVETALKNAGIAYSFYKQPGLWQSDEVRHLNYVLRYLSNPAERGRMQKALLTRFFEFKPEDLSEASLVSDKHDYHKHLEVWIQYALEKRWPKLFKAILEDSKILKRFMRATDWERRTTNLLHVFGHLEHQALSGNMDIHGISHYLDTKFRGLDKSSEEEYHRMESERPKVRIMTMHASKGLEFPVVFVLGGITKGGFPKQYYQFHEGQSVCYDIEKAAGNKEKADAESAAEEKRVMYVALTRAQYKLYLPKYANRGANGPSSKALHKTLLSAWPENECNDVVRHVNTEGIEVIDEYSEHFVEWNAGVLGEEHSTRLETEVVGSDVDGGKGLYLESPYVWNRKLELSSFTGLSSKIAEAAEPVPVYQVDNSKGDDEGGEAESEVEGEVPDVVVATDSNPYDLLPKGANTGSMLHEIFEEVDFQFVGSVSDYKELLVAESDSLAVINYKLRKFGLIKTIEEESELRDPIAKLVYHTLNTPLGDRGVKLCDVLPADRMHEMEFYYPYPNTSPTPSFHGSPGESKGPTPNPKTTNNGYIGGFIDLIFKHNSKYYILDWKSNGLENYDAKYLDEAMDHHNYKLQYKIYSVALYRWLKQRIPDFDPKTQFGGAYYLFLRGMKGENNTDGVYFDGTVTEEHVLSTVESIL